MQIMGVPKRFYWLKLKADFFTDKRIKKMRRLPNGDALTVIYLEMMLKSIRECGCLYYDGIEDSIIEELALDLDEAVEDTQQAFDYLVSVGLLEVMEGEQKLLLPEAKECIGSESDAAERMRNMRKRNNVTHELQGCSKVLLNSNDDVRTSYTEKRREREDKTREEVEKENTSTPTSQKGATVPDASHATNEVEAEGTQQASFYSSIPQQTADVVLKLPTKEGQLYAVTAERVTQWGQLYPDLNIMRELGHMQAWLEANPSKAKTVRGMQRFIVNWLNRSQDKLEDRRVTKAANSLDDGTQRDLSIYDEMDAEDAAWFQKIGGMNDEEREEFFREKRI